MSDQEPVYKFTPPFEGAYLRNVPKRDLTQVDVDNMSGEQRRDAFAVHPNYGAPLYTAVGSTGDDAPKWFQDKLARAQADGVVIQPMEPKETQKAYEERVGDVEPVPLDAAPEDEPDEDGDE